MVNEGPAMIGMLNVIFAMVTQSETHPSVINKN